MEIKIQIRFSTQDAPWLCFRHAAKRAVEKDEEVQVDLDDFDSEYYLGTTRCVDCGTV